MKAIVPVDVKDLKVVMHKVNNTSLGIHDVNFKLYEKEEELESIKENIIENCSFDDKDYNLTFDFDVMIVDVRGNELYNSGHFEIIYDLYLNNKRIKTGLSIKRRYNTVPESMVFEKRIKELMFKKLLQ